LSSFSGPENSIANNFESIFLTQGEST